MDANGQETIREEHTEYLTVTDLFKHGSKVIQLHYSEDKLKNIDKYILLQIICQISDGSEKLESSYFNLGLTFEDNLVITRNAQVHNLMVYQHIPIQCSENVSCQFNISFLGK